LSAIHESKIIGFIQAGDAAPISLAIGDGPIDAYDDSTLERSGHFTLLRVWNRAIDLKRIGSNDTFCVLRCERRGKEQED
jgi:hypothetical protein